MSGLNAITFHTTNMRVACAFWEAVGFDYAYGGPDASFSSFRAGGTTFVNVQLVESGQTASPIVMVEYMFLLSMPMAVSMANRIRKAH